MGWLGYEEPDSTWLEVLARDTGVATASVNHLLSI
jgi:hypothetical protein